MSAPLLICSKSAWQPSIRREHALARLAAAHGHRVTFLERPLDVRALRSAAGARAWVTALRARSADAGAHARGEPGVSVQPQATILPGHLNGLAELTGNALLRRGIASAGERATVVVNVPWQWPATSVHRGRRVFDCADDWSALMTHRSDRLGDLFRRIGSEADAVVLASPSLAERFPAPRAVVVRNGVSEEMLVPPSTGVPPPARMLHAGTLTPRFDARLAGAVLERLPEWTLDLYGQCQYPECGERPGPELQWLLSRHGPRVRWHGVLPRAALAQAIDSATVAVVMNRPEQSLGQDSMKLYDYAARGTPIVTTAISSDLDAGGPPHLYVRDGPAELADAVLAASAEPREWREERRRWAEAQRWEARWPAWSAALFG